MSYFFNPKARVEHLEHVTYYESRQVLFVVSHPHRQGY